ncbi:hypothetical protein HQ584_00940, partial [Patescibacteria group bacterium]|nr:hypothetical protein [Patescibacteria group bacterium]
DVLKKSYTAGEIASIEQGFKANPLKYSQAMGDLILWRMHHKSPEFALEFAQTPEIADGINAQEAKAMNSILQLIKPIEIPKDLYEKKESNSNVHKIIMEWKGNKESDWNGRFLDLGNINYLSGKILTAEPINFEAEDVIDQEYLKRFEDLKWKSVSREGDTDGIIFNLQAPIHKEVIFYINSKELKFTPADLLKKDLVFDEKDGLDGKLTIKNGYQNSLTPELFAIRDMVLAGEGEYRYSSPLQALLWDFMDGKFKEGDNPFKDYKGLVEFVKPIWGWMEGERWRDFDTVTSRLNRPELVDYYTKNRFTYKFYLSPVGSASAAFSEKGGNCVQIEAFQRYCLNKGGYSADLLKVEPWNNEATWHAVTEFLNNGKRFIMDNGTATPIGIIGPFNSLGETNYIIYGGG